MSQAKRAAEIMDAKYGKGWRDRPMLRSPEWARAWQEAGGMKLPEATGKSTADNQDTASAQHNGTSHE
jgi:hypothetical protein